MKVLAAVAAVFLALASPAAADSGDVGIDIKAAAFPTPYFMDLSLTHLIVCEVKHGRYMGTGTSINASDILTAYHVVAEGKCSVQGMPVTTVYSDPVGDVAVVRFPPGARSERRATISCAGFKEGGDYFAVGFALGTDFAVQHLTGTNDELRAKGRPWALLRGNVFHGQSGGPIYDRDGRIVGIVNAAPDDGTPWALSLPLSETYLCAKGAS